MSSFPFRHVLILGGFGFLGRALIARLRARCPEIVITVVDESLSEEFAAAYNVHSLCHDLRGQLWALPKSEELWGADCVINLASYVGTKECADNLRTMGDNVQIALNAVALLQSMSGPRSPMPYFMHASSISVYGSQGLQVNADEKYAEIKPDTAYGCGKALQDQVIQYHLMKGTFRGTIVVPDALFGEGQPSSRFIPSAVRLLMEGQKVPVHGFLTDRRTGEFEGDSRRWLHVDDCANLLIDILCLPEEDARPRWHLAGDRAHTAEQVVDICHQAITGRRVMLSQIEKIVGERKFMCMNVACQEHFLGKIGDSGKQLLEYAKHLSREYGASPREPQWP